jgi:uncharacterized protein with HEPN domain
VRLFLPFRDNPTHFRDILDAISLIDAFLAGFDFEAYKSDLKTKSAVERQMQIITEAAYRLDVDGEKMAPGIDWEGFRGMGNLLRHAYHRIDDGIMWNTVKEELPTMREAATKALAPPPELSTSEAE